MLHNMIVEDEHDTYKNNIDYDSVGNNTSKNVHPSIRSTYLQMRVQLHDKQQHRQLQADLVKHIWERFENENNN